MFILKNEIPGNKNISFLIKQNGCVEFNGLGMRQSVALAKFLAFIYYSEGSFSDFYVGVIADLPALIQDGSMTQSNSSYKVVETDSGHMAHEVVKNLLDLGCREEKTVVDSNAKYVYVRLAESAKHQPQ
jgi:hypothetical protein